MTPTDKNFIQRISISQLLADPSQPHLEDFYFQVHTAIRSRSHPNQPLNSMAQTYLRGRGKRLMESQVLRAVQHARSRPKQEALSLEGALGKIAFHGSGRPRALLDVRRPINAEDASKVLGDKDRHSERRVLRAIENVYDILLDLEEERRPGGSALSDERRQELLDRLWNELGVMEPIDQGYCLLLQS
jgi:DNA topoisomerase 2-associated protein PAT1